MVVFESKQLRALELNVLLLFTPAGSVVVAAEIRIVRPQKRNPSEIDLQEPAGV